MSPSLDKFRDYGLISPATRPPTGVIRAPYSGGQIIGQYIATALMTGLGLILTLVCLLVPPLPYNLLLPLLPLAGFGCLIWLATRNDYAWIELEGRTLRAKHLYTGQIIERPVDEIDDLLTMVFQVRTVATLVTEAWLGRVRGILIRFDDQRTPLQVTRTDPAMSNAAELIAAIVYRLAETGTVEVEMTQRDGQPLVRRVWRKRDGT